VGGGEFIVLAGRSERLEGSRRGRLLITVTDNLNGFSNTIKNVILASTTQICEVYQIRHSRRYVVRKEKKAFSADLKNIYNAFTKEAAALELALFEEKWGGKYPYVFLQPEPKHYHCITPSTYRSAIVLLVCGGVGAAIYPAFLTKYSKFHYYRPQRFLR
jgi:transposase-like protein